jgi:PAS domain S-box-containing protein
MGGWPMGTEPEDKFADLRKQAEAALSAQPTNLSALSPDEVQHLFHELEVHQIELQMQNEELRRVQQELEASRDRFVDLYDWAPVGYITLSESGMILETNLTMATMLGVARGDLLRQPVTRFIFGEDQDIFYLHRQQLFATQAPQVCELRMTKDDRSWFWASMKAIPVQDSEGRAVCRAVVGDITARRQAEQQLKAALAGKERLLKETYHRVRNNLTSLSYLIDIQAETVQDPASLELLSEFQGRLHAMSLVHKSLYQTQDQGPIDFGSYLEELCQHLFYYLTSGRDISLREKIENALLDADRAIHCGMIVNELVTNAFKHAFLDGDAEEHEIRVVFGKCKKLCELVVSDNGVGLPPNLDWRTTESLGLQLVRLWATRQLRGTLDVVTRSSPGATSQTGTTFTIRFPCNETTEVNGSD